MDSPQSVFGIRPRDVRSYADLALIGGFAMIFPVMVHRGATDDPLRIAYAVTYVFFVPGYAFVSAAFPRASDFDWIQRVTLSFGTSIAITALTAIAFNFLPWGVHAEPLAIGITVLTGGLLVIATVRRRVLEKRFTDEDGPVSIPVELIRSVVVGARRPSTRRDDAGWAMTGVTVLLVVAIVLAAGSVGYAFSTPRPGDRYTEVGLYTEQGDELVADEFPSELAVGTSEQVVVSVTNHEFERREYTLAVRFRDSATGRRETVRTVESISVAHDETWQRPVSVTPPFSGNGLYVDFLFYPEASSSPSHRLYLYVNVTAT
jgi:uncharacterized membrane protein